MHKTLSIAGTRAYAAGRVRAVVFGWPVLIFAVAVVMILGGLAALNGDILPLISVAGLMLFAAHAVQLFIKHTLENDALPLPANAQPADYLSTDIIRALGRKTDTSAIDILQAAIRTPRGIFMLEEMAITPGQVMATCRAEVDERVDCTEFVEYAAGKLVESGETRIDANLIMHLLFSQTESGTQLLHMADLSEEDLKGLLYWESFHKRFSKTDVSLSPEAISRNASLGRSWVMGYTDALDALTTEIDGTMHTHDERSIIIHRPIIDTILRVFSRSKQRNVLLMGKVGVGKRTLVRNVAVALRMQERARHGTFTRVLALDTEKLLSGVTNPDTFLLHALSRAQESGHFILVIRDLPLLLKSANANTITVLRRFLEAQTISVIAIADVQDYHKLIKTDPVLDSQFEKIPVEDATEEETLTVLMAHYFSVGGRGARVTYKALKSIMELSSRYLGSFGGFPGKAVDVMEDALRRAAEVGNSFVTEEHVRDVISLKGKVNVKRVSETERDRLLNLDETLKKRIIGQDNAIRAVVSALKRARIDLSDRKRPIGTFLFLGPTGVGKTQTAKVLAEEYFGSGDAIIRMDMNEYSHADSVFGIVGAPGGEGFLAQRVQDKPFSLILLDEIEKAHPSVLNLFLQILDEGFLTDGRGTRTDFRNTIIIATSNAGALFIRDFVREHQSFDRDRFKSDLLETIIREKMFAPEFLNRFDEIVLYYPLSREGAAQVATLMIDEIIGDIRKRRGVSVQVEEDVIGGLVERGYSVEFGAREMRRTITDMIEDYLADYMLRNNVKRGDMITIRKRDLRW